MIRLDQKAPNQLMKVYSLSYQGDMQYLKKAEKKLDKISKTINEQSKEILNIKIEPSTLMALMNKERTQ